MGNDTIAVLGAGTMGQGIAQVAAVAGHQVWLYDSQTAALERAMGRLESALQGLEQKGRLAQPASQVLERIRPTANLTSLAQAHWIIEAVPELLALKQQVLTQAQQTAPQAWLATNTSTLSISQLAAGLPQPERLVGLHFFNPVPRMKLVEVIAGLHTPPQLAQAAVNLAQGMGKDTILVPDTPGFLVNRVARPFYLEAMRLHGEGTDLAAIDQIARGLGFPMGPFALMDLIGLDVNLASSVSVFEAFFGEERLRPHPLQAQRVAAGWLGQKTGQGWYCYPPGPPEFPPAKSRVDGAVQVWVEGDHPLAQQVRQRYATARDPSQAELILDCRIQPDGRPTSWGASPVAALIWGGSASIGRAQLGFGLLPPLQEASIAELYPLPGHDRALGLAQACFSQAGTACIELPEQPGGVGFRLVAALINEAYSALAAGLGQATSLDRAMQLATGYPRGLLQWAGLFDLPTLVAAMKALSQELGNGRYWPHPRLQQQAALQAGTGGQQDMV